MCVRGDYARVSTFGSMFGIVRPVSNPPNPWHSGHLEWIDAPPIPDLEIFEERARTVLSENASPDVGFRFSVNPYRGCFHACSYCYSRPSHQYWDFGAGTDFERKIVVKVNAPEVLEQQMLRPSWKGELIVFSGNTDCYQPLEASYGLTRRLLEVCAKYRNPVGIITKGALIRRDVDVLQELARNARVHVNVSVAFLDDAMARKMEPGAPAPSTRFKALETLAKAGISVGVGVAPIIPGLNDAQIAGILERARDAGATKAFRVMLRLPNEVEPVFLGRLQEAYPDRASKVENAVRDVRGGALYVSAFGQRGRGQGPRWEAIESLFDLTCKRLRLNAVAERDAGTEGERGDPPTTFRRPGDQMKLF